MGRDAAVRAAAVETMQLVARRWAVSSKSWGPEILISDEGPTLRACLRKATTSLHDELDRRMASLAFGNGEHYTCFLAIQYSARLPIERWIEDRNFELAPPRQSSLIAADLEDLGVRTPPADQSRELDHLSAPIGLFWLLAGSSFGNQMISSRRRKLGYTSASRFLDDTRMKSYWHSLRPELEMPASDKVTQSATLAAETGFRIFLNQADKYSERATA